MPIAAPIDSIAIFPIFSKIVILSSCPAVFNIVPIINDVNIP